MVEEIIASGVRYMINLPEFSDGLPFGVLNKSKTDAGGTFVALSCKDNYIVVTPTTDLVDSITADINVTYKMFGVYAGVSYMDFKDYIFRNTTHKIIVTYDSFPKVKSWLDKNGFNSTKYKVLVDEYHLLMEEMGFRDKAINNLMKDIFKFDHYTFMSATPIEVEFTPNVLLSLPHTRIIWDNVRTIRPRMLETPDPFKTVTLVIKEFLTGFSIDAGGKAVKVEELYIFTNSVIGIKQIIDTLGLTNDKVKVVCRKSIRNEAILGDTQISKVTDPNAKLNFFTKKGFQGCNLFSNNGLIIVVSDAHKQHTLIDISTTLHQIAGRLRTNDKFNNVFRDSIWHIYSTLRVTHTDKDFEENLADIKSATAIISNKYNDNFDQIERDAFRKVLNVESLICYLDPDSDKFIYAEMKEQYLRHNHKVVNHIYKNGISVIDAYSKSGFDMTGDHMLRGREDIILKKASTIGFRELITQYMKLKEENVYNDVVERFEVEYPLFKEAWEILGRSGIETCKYVESVIADAVRGKSSDTLRAIYHRFHKKVGDDKFISKRDAKVLLQKICRELNLRKFKPTTSMLGECMWLEVKETQRRVDGKQTEGIIIRQVRNKSGLLNGAIKSSSTHEESTLPITYSIGLN